MVPSRLLTLVLSLILVIALGYLLSVGRSVLIPIVTAVISVYIITTATVALKHLPGFRYLPTALLRVAVIQSAGSVFMTLVNYQVPVWSMIFGALVLSEALPLRFFAALALILTGIAVSQAPQVRRLIGRV